MIPILIFLLFSGALNLFAFFMWFARYHRQRGESYQSKPTTTRQMVGLMFFSALFFFFHIYTAYYIINQ